MRLDKLTIKLQEALQEAISFATESGNPPSLKLLDGSLKEGDRVVIDYDMDKGLVFR